MKVSKKVSNFFGGLFTISLATSVFCCGVKANEPTLLDEPNVATQSASADESADKSNCDQQQLPSAKIQKITSLRLRCEEHGLDSGNTTWNIEDCGAEIFKEHEKFLEKIGVIAKKLPNNTEDNAETKTGNTDRSKMTFVIMTFYDNPDKNSAALPSDDKKASEEIVDEHEISEQAAKIIEQI